MIVSKQGIMVVYTTKADSKIPVLDNIHIKRDGTTIGCGGKNIIAVSPVSDEVRNKLTDSDILTDSKSAPMTIPASLARELLKDIGADKTFHGLLENCDIKFKGDKCVIHTTDGKRKRTIEGKIYPRDYLEYQELLGPALVHMEENTGMRIVLNKKRLLHLLECINKIAPDSSDDDYLWVSFTKEGDIVLRGINYATGQRFIACMWAYKQGESKWLELSEWEKGFMPERKLPVRKRKRKFNFKLKRKRR